MHKNNKLLRYKSIGFFSALVFLCTLIGGCQTASTKEASPSNPIQNSLIHQDSTVYFADKTASISMRASFINNGSLEQPIADGYKLQFRSIKKGNVLISQVSIVAGGKKISLTEGSFFVPYNKGINLQLSKEDTLFISQHNDATFRFKHDNESYLMSIRQHKINEFIL